MFSTEILIKDWHWVVTNLETSASFLKLFDDDKLRGIRDLKVWLFGKLFCGFEHRIEKDFGKKNKSCFWFKMRYFANTTGIFYFTNFYIAFVVLGHFTVSIIKQSQMF